MARPGKEILVVRVLTVFLLGGFALSAGWIVAQDSGGLGSAKRPLDLPSGGLGDEEEDENSPETINFYGASYEGEAFFWCLDQSCSMGWGGGQPIATLRAEMIQAVTSLSSQADFGMVRFHTTHQAWNLTPVRAIPGNKAAAVSWIQSMSADGTTCILPAATTTLQIAALSNKQFKRLILVGDGVPECPPPGGTDQNEQVLQGITAANWQQIPIDTIFISASSEGIALFQAIANANGGTFHNP